MRRDELKHAIWFEFELNLNAGGHDFCKRVLIRRVSQLSETIECVSDLELADALRAICVICVLSQVSARKT